MAHVCALRYKVNLIVSSVVRPGEFFFFFLITTMKKSAKHETRTYKSLTSGQIYFSVLVKTTAHFTNEEGPRPYLSLIYIYFKYTEALHKLNYLYLFSGYVSHDTFKYQTSLYIFSLCEPGYHINLNPV